MVDHEPRQAHHGCVAAESAELEGALLACGAALLPGFDEVAHASGLDRAVAAADLVLTGRGSVDAQTAVGKPRPASPAWPGAGALVVALGGRVEWPAST